jgi:predicted GIY-YIG superfamily endonuclease
MTVEGTVYLLHFERPYKGRMRHYLGFTRNLEQRLENHRQGTACATTKLAFDRGSDLLWLAPGLEHKNWSARLRGAASSTVVRSARVVRPRVLPRPT